VKQHRVDWAIEQRNDWIRLFNRLDAAVAKHQRAKHFPDEVDDALYAAHDRILKTAAKTGPKVR
jgi:hypothetical protein